jgi:hypothetical protein
MEKKLLFSYPYNIHPSSTCWWLWVHKGMLNVPTNDIRPTRPWNHPDAVHDDATLTPTRFVINIGLLDSTPFKVRIKIAHIKGVPCALFWGQEKASIWRYLVVKANGRAKTLPCPWQFATFNIRGWNFYSNFS